MKKKKVIEDLHTLIQFQNLNVGTLISNLSNTVLLVAQFWNPLNVELLKNTEMTGLTP